MTFRRNLASRWLTLLLAVLSGWMLYQGARIMVRVHQAGQELARLQERADELDRDIARLQEHLARTDEPAWLEYQARLRLNYRYPDEKAVVVYKKENSGTISPVASAGEEQETVPFWRRWWNRVWGAEAGLPAEAP
jgi:cell division protein FtsB